MKAILHRFTLTFVLALAVLPSFAAEKKDSPAGTWKFSFTPPGGQLTETTVKIKSDAGKLSAVYLRKDAENPLDDVKFKDGQLSFSVTRETNGQKLTIKFDAKLTGDTMKGKATSDDITFDWDAKREAPASGAAGTWDYTLDAGGTGIEFSLKLTQDGEKLSGTVTILTASTQAPISDGTLKGDAISFNVVRERDGKKFTSRYTGKLTGNSIKGKITSNFTGDDVTYEWDAKRAK